MPFIYLYTLTIYLTQINILQTLICNAHLCSYAGLATHSLEVRQATFIIILLAIFLCSHLLNTPQI